MLNGIVDEGATSPLHEIAFALLEAGADRQADAIYAEIEARERATAADAGTVIPFPARWESVASAGLNCEA